MANVHIKCKAWMDWEENMEKNWWMWELPLSSNSERQVFGYSIEGSNQGGLDPFLLYPRD